MSVVSVADEIAKLHELLVRGAITSAEYEQAKAKLLAAEAFAANTPTPPTAMAALNRLRRSNRDRWLAGVCGGLAQATGIEAWIWRLIMVVGLFAGGVTAFIYVLAWVFVPPAEPASF